MAPLVVGRSALLGCADVYRCSAGASGPTGDMDFLRRSSRKRVKENALDWDQQNFCVKRVEEVDGRGVFATRNFEKGSFLLPYLGTLCLEDPNKEDETFIFQFSSKGITYWIDASIDDGSLGRLISDDHVGPNCIPKPLGGDTPGIGFFALKDIAKGQELRYCYGNKNEDYPWRRQKKPFQHDLKGTKSLEELTFCGLLKILMWKLQHTKQVRKVRMMKRYHLQRSDLRRLTLKMKANTARENFQRQRMAGKTLRNVGGRRMKKQPS